jgi:hypothetical protein
MRDVGDGDGRAGTDVAGYTGPVGVRTWGRISIRTVCHTLTCALSSWGPRGGCKWEVSGVIRVHIVVVNVIGSAYVYLNMISR